MATILPFVVRPKPPGTRPAPPAEAVIVIFPGVRYERQTGDDVGTTPQAPAAGSRRRKSK